MFDLHSHILPALDDGAKDLAETVGMLEIASKNGSKGIVATPHLFEGNGLIAWKTILDNCESLNVEAQRLSLNITVYPGAEVFLCLDILERIEGPGAYCINNGRYLLVELPSLEIPRYAEEFFFTLQTRGITPILAHPERHPDIIKKPEILAEWVNKGILVQVNGPSLTGRFGERIMKTAEILLSHDMVHCIGSDAHSIRSRNPDLTKAYEKIHKLVGPERSERILKTNPGKIIANCEFEAPKILDLKVEHQRRGIFKWLDKIKRLRG